MLPARDEAHAVLRLDAEPQRDLDAPLSRLEEFSRDRHHIVGRSPMRPWLLINLALVAAVLSACSSLLAASLPEPGEIVTVVGRVRSIDSSPMAYDGPAEIVVDSEDFGRVSIFVQSCLGGCALGAVGQLGDIQPGERWQITGEVIDARTLVLYVDDLHSLAPAGTTD